jgi:hypothetical protein
MSEDPLSDCQEYAAELEERLLWISDAERLPEQGAHDLIVSDGYIRIAAYDALNGGSWIDDDSDGTYPPTHWMRLPDPPRESEPEPPK